MGLNIGGIPIVVNAKNGITFNNTLAFDSNGFGTANPIPGYSGWKAAGGSGTHYAAPTGWEVSAVNWQSGLNTGNGVFTCPITGLYALGYNGIHDGGSGFPAGYNTYGYSAFCKNGAMNYWVHWNMNTTNSWNTGGQSVIFNCAAGDTLALFINRSPTSVAPDSISQNKGMYPDAHSCVWCKLVG